MMSHIVIHEPIDMRNKRHDLMSNYIQSMEKECTILFENDDYSLSEIVVPVDKDQGVDILLLALDRDKDP